ncbi:N-acyl homoserine lactonase family protein [Streptomyces sp. NBC_01594]|uniref:N-acyl homoserine lactonase family protein n=1 Tax=Streptomyces sp. NBC_01594 TaxID=2975890 RepID=UPI003863CFBB
MANIIPIKTGTIRIRPSHRAGNMNHPVWRRRLAMLTDRDWTEPLPIYTYLIEHDEGLILLDCGETSRAGFFPWWHPFFRFGVDLNVEPGDEIGSQLRARGIDPGKDLKTLVLSHLHHDHADGLEHFDGTEIIVSEENYQASQGLHGAIMGAVPSQWPTWFEPVRREFDGPSVAGFDTSMPLTSDGTVFAVPTPGHMPGHLSVVVRNPGVTYFLAGDATYDQDLLRQRIVDGPSSNLKTSLDTMDRITTFAESEATVLLPAHDPAAGSRLAERITLA